MILVCLTLKSTGKDEFFQENIEIQLCNVKRYHHVINLSARLSCLCKMNK